MSPGTEIAQQNPAQEGNILLPTGYQSLPSPHGPAPQARNRILCHTRAQTRAHTLPAATKAGMMVPAFPWGRRWGRSGGHRGSPGSRALQGAAESKQVVLQQRSRLEIPPGSPRRRLQDSGGVFWGETDPCRPLRRSGDYHCPARDTAQTRVPLLHAEQLGVV